MAKETDRIDKITREMTFGEVYNIPEFSEYKRYLMYNPSYSDGLAESPMASLRLSEISSLMPTWNGDSIATGLNRILELEKLGSPARHDIWSDEEKAAEPDRVDAMLFHFPGHEGKPFVVVCAGGGYMSVASMVEAFPVATRLNEMGYTAFVLNYRVGKERLFPAPSEDLVQAVRFVLSRAEEFTVAKKGYAVAGFSAGAHLAATLGTDNYGYKKHDLPKPAALFLGYPLVTTDEIDTDKEEHQGMLVTLTGKGYTVGMLDALCINKNMSQDFPSTYLWMCKDDDIVSFRNSMILAEKLDEFSVPFIFKKVERGGHGLGLGMGTAAEGWLEEAVDFWGKH